MDHWKSRDSDMSHKYLKSLDDKEMLKIWEKKEKHWKETGKIEKDSEWRYNRRNNTIVQVGSFGYEIDLDKCDSSAQVLDWIIQVGKKSWCSPKTLSDLVLTFDAVLDLQANYCSWGVERKKK